MKGHSRPLARPWMLPVGVVVLIAGPVILYYVLSHAGLPAAVVSGVILLMVIKHLGLLAVLLGPLYACSGGDLGVNARHRYPMIRLRRR
jgi:hypothetical protein